ncbi:unnamed protein product [Bemisia tabaci]|uniref:Homeobox protein homothorax-like n=1 Tax=Bemisia tabaci TaxID=7038 RepID=A0A9P0F779_BEMTA|nr:unnamed protein product [Bemisia tabaci]
MDGPIDEVKSPVKDQHRAEPVLRSTGADCLSVRFSPIFSPHAGPSGAYSPDAAMGYMMDGSAQMMAAHRAPGDPPFHGEYHYPAQYYGHHL